MNDNKLSLSDKYRPKKIGDLFLSPKNKTIIKEWIKNYKTCPEKSKKVLLITGPTGCGKTTLARLIFKYYKFRAIEYDSVDLKLKSNIKKIFTKSFQYNNVINMFNGGKSPSGIIIDELEIIINNKIEKNNVLKTLLVLLKKDSKNKFKIKYPIICTYSPFSNKNLTKLKKFSYIVKLNKPNNQQLISFIDKIKKKEKFKIDFDASVILANYADGDISRLLKLLEILLTKTKYIKLKHVDKIKESFFEKNQNLEIYDMTKQIINNKLEYDTITDYYFKETMLLPLMIYDNFYQRLLTKKKNHNIQAMIDGLQCFINYDKYQNYIIKNQSYDLSYVNSFNMVFLNNIVQKNKHKNFISNINFAKILTNASLFYSNKKRKAIECLSDLDLMNEIKSVYEKNDKII